MIDRIQQIKNNFSLIAYCKANLKQSKTAPNQFNCPFCNSGNGQHGTGALTVHDDTQSYFCHSCQQSGDIINLHEKLNGFTRKEAIEDLYKQIGSEAAIQTTKQKTSATTSPALTVKTFTDDDYKAIQQAYAIYNNAIDIEKAPKALDYLLRRGVTNEQIKQYGFKYNASHQSVCYMVGSQLFERAISPEIEIQKRKYGRQTSLFNEAAIFNHKKIIVVEGAFDCLSVLSCIDNELTTCVALGSTGNNALFNFTADKSKEFYLLLDSDQAGIKRAHELKEKIGVNAQILTLPSDCQSKDCNELYLADKEKLKTVVASVLVPKLKSMNFYSDFLFNREYKDLLKTGFDSLDTCLQGGLDKGLYVIGATSGTGKSTLCLNIMDNLAQRGVDCLYFSLEMSKLEHVRRSLSGLSYDLEKPLQLKQVMEALRHDKASIKPLFDEYCKANSHRYIIDDVNTIEDIKQAVLSYSQSGSLDNAVVFVDYLQLVGTNQNCYSDKQRIDLVTTQLKEISMSCPVIVISSLNRDSYYSKPDITSLKESGGIEYTANVAMILTYNKILNTEKTAEIKATLEDLKKEASPIMSLVCVKGRDIPSGFVANFMYHKEFYKFKSLTLEQVKQKEAAATTSPALTARTSRR